jgi:hypothetical protein
MPTGRGQIMRLDRAVNPDQELACFNCTRPALKPSRPARLLQCKIAIFRSFGKGQPSLCGNNIA